MMHPAQAFITSLVVAFVSVWILESMDITHKNNSLYIGFTIMSVTLMLVMILGVLRSTRN